MASTAKDFDEVFEEELHEIRARREVCRSQSTPAPKEGISGSETPPSDEEIEDRLRDELAGVALSGGGVRSAAFNLGLLQALYQSGRMQDVDYLSTVSGGGYAGALFSAAVANDKDGVNWGRASRFNRLPIEPRPDGSQPPRVYELALHGRAMSRPLQWLSRHLWGWILTILFVISGVIAIASILAWLMRIVWSQENLPTAQAQGFSTDLHIAFYPAFLALLFWAFCNLASVVMRAVNVRIPPISRFAYVLLIVTIVLGMVSFSAIGDFNMADYVSAQLVPADWSAKVNSFLDNLGKIALGLLSLCLLPLLAPHKLMESGRHREKPLYRFAFNTAGFAIICGVPLAVFYLLSREDVSGYNLERPNSDMMTQSHLSELENFIPRLAAESPIGEDLRDRRELVARKIHDAIVASGEDENYPRVRKQILDDRSKTSMPTRLLQYAACSLGLYGEFEDLVENRRKATRSRARVAKYISSDVLSNPWLFDPWTSAADVDKGEKPADSGSRQTGETADEQSKSADSSSAVAANTGVSAPKSESVPADQMNAEAAVGKEEALAETSETQKTDDHESKSADSTAAAAENTGESAPKSESVPADQISVEAAVGKPEAPAETSETQKRDEQESKSADPTSPVAENAGESALESERVLKELHLDRQLGDAEKRNELQEMIEEIRVQRKVINNDYAALSNARPDLWWELVFYRELLKIYPDEELNKLAKIRGTRDTEFRNRAKEKLPKLTKGNLNNNRRTFRIILTASVMDDLNTRRQTNEPDGAGSGPKPEVIFARRLTLLQHLLEMDSIDLVEKLDDKLALALGDDYREDPQFQATFERLHEAEREDVALQLQPIRTSNWAVLSAMYPDYIKPRETVYAWNVNAADQAFRLRVAGYSTLVFLLVGLLANLNRMCLHGVYRDQLAAVWLPTGPLMLKDLDTCRRGGPLHLFNATLNRHGWQLDPDPEGMSRFVFSNRFCGSKRFGYRETWEYENGEMGLADAVAISGAAVSTSYTGDLLFRTLLFLTNFRLGQWVRNPKHFHEEHYWPSPLRILISDLWHPTDRAYVDLTDGGHLDNTGLSSLLERRCRVMILGDCSQDEKYQFEDLFAVLQAARAKYGIQIDEFQDNESKSNHGTPTKVRSIDALARLIPDESKNFESQSHFAVFRLRYPEKRHNDGDTSADTHRDAVLIVIKPTLTGDEPPDLLTRRRLNDGFPNDSTVNQFLDPEQFEAYVMLGYHIGKQLDQFILAGNLDRYHLPAAWRSPQPHSPEAEQGQEMPASATAGTGERVADRVTSDESGQPSVSSELPGPSAVAQLLDSLRFDKPGIGVAIALIRQWAEAEYENDQELLSAGRDVFDHIIRPVSKWAYEEGSHRPRKLRRLFCNKLIEILEEHTWIANEADQETRNDFRNMLEGLGGGVAAAGSAIASLSRDSEQVS